MFSYHSNGKLQPATIWNLNHLFSLPAPARKQWHNCTTKEDKSKEKRVWKKSRFRSSKIFLLSLLLRFCLASFRNVKCGKCGFLVISVVFVKSISDIFFSVLHTGCLSSIKNNRDCWTIWLMKVFVTD